MTILNRSFNTDCMLVPKNKLSLHWVAVKSSCKKSCWVQDFTFGTDGEAYLKVTFNMLFYLSF